MIYFDSMWRKLVATHRIGYAVVPQPFAVEYVVPIRALARSYDHL